jgi:3-oxoacyl-[acyl-carrier-protein] synthase-3
MVDFFVMHQANKFIIEHLSKKMKIPLPKVPISLENYGNTSSASIPITMTHNLSDKLSQDKLHILLSGFGVGYSWGAAAITCGPLVMPDIVIVPQNSNNNYKKGVY